MLQRTGRTYLRSRSLLHRVLGIALSVRGSSWPTRYGFATRVCVRSSLKPKATSSEAAIVAVDVVAKDYMRRWDEKCDGSSRTEAYQEAPAQGLVSCDAGNMRKRRTRRLETGRTTSAVSASEDVKGRPMKLIMFERRRVLLGSNVVGDGFNGLKRSFAVVVID